MSESMRILKEATIRLRESLERGGAEGARKAAEKACREALAKAGENSDAGSVLARALKEATKVVEDRDAARILGSAIDEAILSLNFKPRIEAKLPEGFPDVTPVDAIEVKEYPRVRSAEAKAGASLPGGRNILFFQLFGHIQRNGIAMTAPVVMSYRERPGGEPDRMDMTSMAFLYDSPATGRAGQDGNVEVRDLEPVLVVSLGLRGEYTTERFGGGLRRLEAWLEKNGSSYARAGSPRILAYNSPMVPAAEKYSEVQIPVKRLPVSAPSSGKIPRDF